MTTRARGWLAAILVLAVVLVAGGVWLATRGPDLPPPSDDSRAPQPTQALKVGVYGSPGTWWPDNGITNVYLTATENDTAFPLDRLRALIHQGTSLNLTITTRQTDYLAGVADDDPAAVAWLTAYVENVGRLATFAERQANGAYVVATVFHESAAQVTKGHVVGASTDFETIGRAQQKVIALGRQLAPQALWSVWLVGGDRVDEGVQLAQITDPKPDLLTVDPYANRDCSSTLADVATPDLEWLRQQPAYAGRVAISETGMTTTCSDADLAAFYDDVPAQLRALGDDVLFYVMFNSDNGTFPHYLTDGRFPQAVAALRASLAR